MAESNENLFTTSKGRLGLATLTLKLDPEKSKLFVRAFSEFITLSGFALIILI